MSWHQGSLLIELWRARSYSGAAGRWADPFRCATLVAPPLEEKMRTWAVTLFVAGCKASLTCGDGTLEEDGVCVAEEDGHDNHGDDDDSALDTGESTAREDCFLDISTEDSSASHGPVVQSTCPRNGAVGVDPDLDRIEIAFSRSMADSSWSWVQVDDTFPELSEVFYESDRVHVGLVDLEPNSTYAIWLNYEPNYLGFVDVDWQPAVPYFLVFETGAGG
jgi:hypothetical protein